MKQFKYMSLSVGLLLSLLTPSNHLPRVAVINQALARSANDFGASMIEPLPAVDRLSFRFANTLSAPHQRTQASVGFRNKSHVDEFLTRKIKLTLPQPWQSQAEEITQSLLEASRHWNIDPALLTAIIQNESHFQPEAKGRFGELGLMQIKPSTARWLAVQMNKTPLPIEHYKKILLDPKTNIRFGASYLAYLKSRFRGRYALFISAYNMGPSNVRVLMKDNDLSTVYYRKVKSLYNDLYQSYLQHQNQELASSPNQFFVPVF